MNKALVWLGLGLGALGLYYVGMQKPARFLGDKAALRDQVFVPIAPGGPGTGVPGVPAGASQIVVRVDRVVGADILEGPVVGFALPGAAGFIPLPPTGSPSIDRRNVLSILRNGQTVT